MSSDLGTNPNRVDIKVDVTDSPVDTIEKIITAIENGETFIKANVDIDLKNCYENALAEAIRKIGIDDIRYGTMSHYLGGGVGYTLYKGKTIVSYDKIGDRGHYQYSETLGCFCHGIEETLAENLKKYGVKSADVDFSNFDSKTLSVLVVVTLYLSEDADNKDGTSRKIKFNQHVDASALDGHGLILEGYCGATKAELATLDKALEEHELEDLEPELYNFMAQEYALRTMPNECDGGEWME